ncbi:hypothetical protein RVX78_002132 [Enterobacter cloacae]|nr:hypothetical protein [Enterobacter cloacae]
MTLEYRIEQLEQNMKAIEARHALEDEEIARVKAAISQAAKKGIEDLLIEQPK